MVDVYQSDSTSPQSDPTADGPATDAAPTPPAVVWQKQSLPVPRGGSVAGSRVQQHLVLSTVTSQDDALVAEVAVLRGQRRVTIGSLELSHEQIGTEAGQWRTVAAGDSFALLAGPRDIGPALLQATRDGADDALPGPAVTQLSLQGKVTRTPWTLGFEPREFLSQAFDTIILLGVVLTSTVLLFGFWRRDPEANRLALPDTMTLGDPLRRGLAGLIDLAPGILVGTLGYGLDLGELYQRWPGRGLGASFDMMVPGMVAIGVVVLHTTLLELLTTRSIGKWATGLRVVGLDGEQPRPWQLLVRGVLKIFDLVAYLLLILPLISPYRQRLGDLVARTVVVMSRDDDEVAPARADKNDESTTASPERHDEP